MTLFKKVRKRYLAITICALLLSQLSAQDQHGWRGPNRNGIYPDTNLLKEWSENGPKQLWETLDAGKGYSSPVIVEDHLYITGMNEAEDKEIFSAYTLDGKREYVIEYGLPWNKSFPETRTTPTIVGKKAYMTSGMGDVVCIDIKKGEIIWTVDGTKQFGVKTGRWGVSESPLIIDNKVIFTPGGDQTTMVALDAKSGDIIWKTKSLGDICNYGSPLLIEHNGIKQIVGITGKNVIGVNPDNGEIIWTFNDWGQVAEERGREKISPNTPLFKDGKIFVSSGYNVNSFLLQLNDDATDVSVIWRNEDLDTHLGGYVLVDHTIYGSNWLNNAKGNWVAVDWNTGETKYETEWEGKGKGAIISADGMLYCYDEKQGYVGLVPANSDSFKVVSEFKITKGEGPFWAHPVINQGILYVRHGNALMAFAIK